ncbi:Ribokinase [Curvibacter sp. AEP1-3]|uniref:ribokinase n=1 Tax=Curvibacter sp. AEP1-3 TaxID=1844971 RepID=UPI000B3CA4E5|nr:ribokinase [Curvibacter sp. AEP1-3]ARV17282.1 Ribokinase [Curvibacter sp. AEP1-3]
MILVAGSANLDFVVRAHHIPAPGETVLGRDFQTFPGGKGANQAVASARAGGAVTHMLLGLGQDAFATPLENSLQSAGVQMHIVRTPDQPTGTAFICVSDDAENAITVAPGANAELRPEHLPSLAGFTHLLLQLETPLDTVTSYARAARAQGVQVVLNAAPARALPSELLAQVDVLVVNEGELAVVSGHEGSIADCLARVAVPTVVVTLGHRGSCARHNGAFALQSAFPISPVDTTGAGDTFCGSLVAALSQGQPLADALRFASAASAIACTRWGAQSSIPETTEVEALLASTPSTSAEEALALRAFCGLN